MENFWFCSICWTLRQVNCQHIWRVLSSPPTPSDSILSTVNIVCFVSLSLPPPCPCSSNVPVLHYSHVPSHASFFSVFFVSHAPPIDSCLYHMSSLSPRSPLHVLLLLRAPSPPPPFPSSSVTHSPSFLEILWFSSIFFFYKNGVVLWSILALCRLWSVLALYRLLMMGEVPKYIYCISNRKFSSSPLSIPVMYNEQRINRLFHYKYFFLGGGWRNHHPLRGAVPVFSGAWVGFLAMVCQLKWAENWTSLEKTGCVCLL